MLISEFWKEFEKRFGKGGNRLFLNPTAINYLDEDEFSTIGKVFMFGFIMLEFLPFEMNQSFLYYFMFKEQINYQVNIFTGLLFTML